MQGTRIGTYQIEREIGRGGMGVVYLGRDTSLDRPVAIKALPAEVAADPNRLERFEREARTLAQLSDPHVAGIYGTVEHEGQRYLVLEYIEGETLADRLDRGPLPIDDTLELAAQIAAGLEAAHEAGVIHRDLKPANVKLTPEGKAVVLDFGLAKAEEGASSTGLSDAATLTTPSPHSPSIPGAVIGTAAYMSPEQARGRKVDRRTDIWAFGVVLYEMLSGASPFAGETATDSIGAVLHKGVDLDRLPDRTPPGVRRLIERCLERDKNQRLQAIGDARIELQNELGRLGSGITEPGAAPERSRPIVLPAAISAFVAAVATGLAITLASPTPVPVLTTSSTPPTPVIGAMQQLTDFDGLEQTISLSPDGRTLLYAVQEGKNRNIYFLRVGGTNPINLTPNSPADDFDPVFSPDGEQIAFCSTREGGGVFIMGATGENPRRVANSGFDPAWSPDGRSLIVTSEEVTYIHGRTTRAVLSVIDLATREIRTIDIDPLEVLGFSGDAVDPSYSPDGSRIAFWSVVSGRRDIFTIPADGGGPAVPLTTDIPTDWSPVWAGSGSRVLFLSDRGGSTGVWSIDLDPATGEPTGEPAPVLRGPTDLLEIAATPDSSRLAFLAATKLSRINTLNFDRESSRFVGEPVTLVRSNRDLHQPWMAADGSRLLWRSGPPQEDIYIANGDGSNSRRLLDDLHRDRAPRFFENADKIYWYSNRDGGYSVWEMRTDGTGMRRFEGIPASNINSPHLFDSSTRLIASVPTRGGSFLVEYQLGSDDVWEEAAEPAPDLISYVASPSGRLVTCVANDGTGTWNTSIYDRQTGETVRIRRPEGSFIQDVASEAHTWLDDQRLLFIDLANAGDVLLVDAETGQSRATGDFLPRTWSIQAYQEGSRVVYVSDQDESEVWLAELNPSPENDR